MRGYAEVFEFIFNQKHEAIKMRETIAYSCGNDCILSAEKKTNMVRCIHLSPCSCIRNSQLISQLHTHTHTREAAHLLTIIHHTMTLYSNANTKKYMYFLFVSPSITEKKSSTTFCAMNYVTDVIYFNRIYTSRLFVYHSITFYCFLAFSII